ncbi:MAG: helix-turn-helix transcriptional regulator [Acidobacteria bacterium]|nr:helix-turn-helix transcriptional regulator [Acidobacteriota bacterium]MCB9396986.1 helix-turn-helix transcriptional regulator [Acidobacteriota bacterium]
MKAKKQAPGYFSISIVAETYGIHPQTLRLYEREGLLCPSRTEGNTRLYSQEDVERLEAILSLTRELGVNLAGVDIILKMRAQMESMQQDINELLSAFRQVMIEKMEDGERVYKNSLVRVSPKTQVIRIHERE